METKEKWVESILESCDGMKQIMPNEALLSKITSKINAEQPIPMLTKWMIAAAITILISLNVALAAQETNNNDATNPIGSLLDIEGNQLY